MKLNELYVLLEVDSGMIVSSIYLLLSTTSRQDWSLYQFSHVLLDVEFECLSTFRYQNLFLFVQKLTVL